MIDFTVIRRGPGVPEGNRAADGVVGMWKYRFGPPKEGEWLMLLGEGTVLHLEPTDLLEIRFDGRSARVVHIVAIDAANKAPAIDWAENQWVAGWCGVCGDRISHVESDTVECTRTSVPCGCKESYMPPHSRRALGLAQFQTLNRGMPVPASDEVRFPVKLNDSYTCQGVDAEGVSVAFDDLLKEGDQVGTYSNGQGDVWGLMGTVVREEDGLWIRVLPTVSPA